MKKTSHGCLTLLSSHIWKWEPGARLWVIAQSHAGLLCVFPRPPRRRRSSAAALIRDLRCGNILLLWNLPLLAIDSVHRRVWSRRTDAKHLFLFVHLCLSPDEAPWIRLSTACSPGRVITPDLRRRVTPSRRPIITPTTSRDPRTPATHPDSLTPGRATPEPWSLATTPTKGRVSVFAGLPKK